MNTWLSVRIVGILLFLLSGKDRPPRLPLPPEICENALDDDGDGMIDLNDPDCVCAIIEPISRIPNPSFEESNCCPSGITQLHCADTWIQASAPTTDYLNTCGWMGWDNLPPPLPFPDGNGAVGFRDGRNIMGQAEPWWKEYVGACLLAPLLKDIPYRIEFHLGFTNSNNSPPISVTFFGTTDCQNLPFGNNDQMFGCPTNGPGWIKLGEVSLSGSNRWVKANIDIVPPDNIQAITIGPACSDRPANTSYYYFIDNLILDEQAAFNYQISTNGESPCSNSFALQVPAADSLQYQWYKDGIALLGEDQAQLQVQSGEGAYQVRISGLGGCKVTNVYDYRIPVARSFPRAVLCEGETLRFGAEVLNRGGSYIDTLKTNENCDSIVQLEVVEAFNQQTSLSAKIFESERFRLEGQSFSRPGSYPIMLTSMDGCDSLVTLNLAFYKVFIPSAFSPNDDGINDFFSILGDEVELLEIKSLQVFDKWGNLVYAGEQLAPNQFSSGWDGKHAGRPAAGGIYVYSAILIMNDGLERRLSGNLSLIR